MIAEMKDAGYGVCLIALMSSGLLLPSAAVSAPNGNSLAEIGVCEEDASTARVCSSKDLSNVVLQCGDAESSYYVKFDDLDDPENWPEGQLDPEQLDLGQGSFMCPEGDTLLAVFVKSGSEKYDGELAAPAGSGAVWSPLGCATEGDCTTISEELAE